MTSEAALTRYFQVAGYILAGGESARMGADKGGLEISGIPMVVRTAQLLGPLVSKRTGVTLVAPSGRYTQTGLPSIPDDRPGQGPLGGIATALRVSPCPWNIIVGCDLPYLTQEWLGFLIGRAVASHSDIVFAETSNGPEPLCAMYHKRCEPSFLAALAKGTRKITEAFVGREVETISAEEWAPFDSGGLLFKNVNTPEDFEDAKARLRE